MKRSQDRVGQSVRGPRHDARVRASWRRQPLLLPTDVYEETIGRDSLRPCVAASQRTGARTAAMRSRVSLRPYFSVQKQAVRLCRAEDRKLRHLADQRHMRPSGCAANVIDMCKAIEAQCCEEAMSIDVPGGGGDVRSSTTT